MAILDDMFPKKWLSAKDLEEQDMTVTIKRIEEETIGKEDKFILFFAKNETEKGLVLNQTNAKTIAKLHGNDTDEWIGKRITLFPTEVQYLNDMVPAIRIRSKAPSKLVGASKVQPLTQAEADAPEDADDTPF